jgi:hypothetical protein
MFSHALNIFLSKLAAKDLVHSIFFGKCSPFNLLGKVSSQCLTKQSNQTNILIEKSLMLLLSSKYAIMHP